MRKLFSILLILFGVVFLLYGTTQFFQSYFGEQDRLDEARKIISESGNKEIADVVSKREVANISNEQNETKPEISHHYTNIQYGDTIGILYIPRLEREIPIIEGTDEEELAVGVGHYSDTGFPGENKQILLSGHRDTVFRQFDQLENGDEFHIKMKNGTFIYEINDHEIVAANDQTVIDTNRAEEFLTVSTCYPFSYIGNAPDRYVLYAYPK